MLEKSGYEVAHALTAEHAFVLLQKDPPDLVLLDLLLPGMQGEDLCKKIKSDDRLKNIPVILFTAISDNIQRIAREVGAQDYVKKPFDIAELLAKVKKLTHQDIK